MVNNHLDLDSSKVINQKHSINKEGKIMQPKISAFFKPKSSDRPPISDDQIPNFDNDLPFLEKQQPEIRVTYTRRVPNPDSENVENPNPGNSSCKLALSSSGRKLNRKRSYAQFHLELGQSNFMLHSCSICGLHYASGDEADEKFHKTFHRNYTHGIQFKGWRNERLVDMLSIEGGRIILVLDGDSSAQKNKVQEVVHMMETELGDGWILHKLCKVYLFVSSLRIAGCLVAEPVKAAHRIISSSEDVISHGTDAKEARLVSTILQCGNVKFQREVNKRTPSRNGPDVLNGNLSGSIICEEEAVPAVCGIRAIWVTPSNRRKHIASQLLDAARKSFCPDLVLGKSQLAFSQPTSSGKALASKYIGTQSFLVYKSS